MAVKAVPWTSRKRGVVPAREPRDGYFTSDFKCESCGRDGTSVCDSRGDADGRYIRRRRVCLHCGERFTTYECRDHPSIATQQANEALRRVREILAVLEANP